ncbi:MAG: HIT family protein [Thaumarchaeota archaeon]|nr:HIT family protein [Nitrososphaerota archaeon]
MESECIFCKIVEGKVPSAMVWQDDDYACFLDKYPMNPGHALVVPKKHYPFLLDMTLPAVGKLFEHTAMIMYAICKVLKPDGVNIGQSNGEVASQTVFHVHVHIIPRFKGDSEGSFWPERKKFTLDRLNDLAEQIAKAIPTKRKDRQSS